ncbi:BQ5605_C009g05636 [Microbotryum silenes-dioicae]|uniref:U1 small nuclear ribonucleoprotein 70 kDa n=1 Tax=Microbotryum silenes-dioicae TaxID=796604 RepID=A0A2X0N0M9_9BASI|nr:BQ5605_C009g05636 [Microbotryum silenes-dioicae]
MVGTHLLPPNLLRLFAPRAPLPFLTPTGRDPDVPLKSLARKPPALGVSETWLAVRYDKEKKEQQAFEAGERPDDDDDPTTNKPTSLDQKPKPESKDPKLDPDSALPAAQEQGEIAEQQGKMPPPPSTVIKKRKRDELVIPPGLSATERAKLKEQAKKARHEKNLAEGIENYRPQDDPEAVGDPYKTLFVGRIPYEITEQDLRREFDLYGPLERVHLVRNKDGKSRGYAFLVYERERDMKAAYKDADGLKLLGKRLLIDVERGRTVKGWRPRRLGGGLGGRPKKVVPVPVDPFAQSGPPGGFAPRGGFGARGGFGGGGRGGFVQRGGFGGGGGRGGFQGGGGGFRGGFQGGQRGGFQGGDSGGRGGFQSGGGRGGYQGQNGPDAGYGNRGGFGGGGEKRPFDSGPGRGGFSSGGGGGYDNSRPRY